MKSVIISIAFSCIIQLIHAKLTQKYDYTTFLDKTNTSVKFSWKYDVDEDKLFVGLEVEATGFVGWGFAHKIFEMQNYDVVMGSVHQNGNAVFSDRHTIGNKEPPVDLQQDYNMTYYEEVNGTTTFEFNRKRLTNDSKDIDIKLGPMLVVYAYHSIRDFLSPYGTPHDHQGYKELVLLPLDTQLPSSSTSPTSSPGTTAEARESLATLPSDTASPTSSPGTTAEARESLATLPSDTTSPTSMANSSDMITTTESSSPGATDEALGSMAMPCSLPTGISLGLMAMVWHLFIL